MSTDTVFLERYRQVAARAPGETPKRQCGRCSETLCIAHFSVDKKRKDKTAVICKHCNREGIERSRVKKRVWQREDEYYKIPGGYGATAQQRLDALVKRLADHVT